jgi:protein phosphatase
VNDHVLDIPELSLVVLIGASGSGKSTFAARHFLPTQVLSSDRCRGMVSDDENDQAATNDAFEVLHFIAGKRLASGRLTVIDATNVHKHGREQLIRLAREHDVLPVAIVLDLPESVCVQRNTGRPFGADVVRRQRADLRRSMKSLQREGFRKVHVLRSESEVDCSRIRLDRLFNDRRDDTGPFDVIGDVHGCRAELEALLSELGYRLERDEQGRPVDAAHPDGRRVILLGDLVDRGPDTPGVLRLAMGMVASGNALAVAGNHENKLVRALRGRKVQISHGLEESLDQLSAEDDRFQRDVLEFCDGLVAHYVLDNGNLVVAHAGLPERYHGRASGRVRSFALYGDTTGETDEFGLPVRYPWARDYRGHAAVLYGHTPVPEVEWVNRTLCLDTGCVFGGKLTALRYPEREIVSVPAAQVWHEPVRPLRSTSEPDAAPERQPDVLDLGDVTGKRVLSTRHHGRITVGAEQSAAALEVMSRFAIDPRHLLYLPPTMSPCSTAQHGDLLEHPEQAFADYRKSGVHNLVCEEKHMGSRAVVLLCRDSETSAKRFGTGEGYGAVYTRTGRSFFTPELTDRLLARMRATVTDIGLWDELGTDWLLLDAEILPWSAKAQGLIREQFASTGSAAESALSSAIDVLRQAEKRGLEVGEMTARTESRHADAQRFRAAYRRYCWPTEGLDGVRVAPFQVLAGEGRTHSDTAHEWHLAIADRLADAAPELFTATRWCGVDTEDSGSVTHAVRWWEDITASGGEGMVVKPSAALARGRKGLAQPGIKVRGREYLRLVYGPEYTEPQHLDRVRQRQLGRKRSLALREYALGLEALSRLAEGEPLWRVHECVFAVLALESEAVDPRL